MSRGRAPGPGSLRKRGGQWVLDWQDGSGNRRRQALGPNKADAERKRAELIRRRDMERDGLGAIAGLDLTLAEIVPDYLEDLRPRVTPRHIKNVSGKLAVVLEELGETKVRDLKPMALVRLRSRLTAEGRSNRTANLYPENLRTALSWAVEAGLIAANPLQRMRRLPTTRDHQVYRRRALTEAELVRFLEAAREDDDRCELLATDVRIPVTPFFLALLCTGARYGEAIQIRWGDLDFTRESLVVRAENAKSRRQRVIPLGDDLIEALRALAVAHGERFGRLPSADGLVFLSPMGERWPWHTANIMRILDRVLAHAGIPKIDTEGQKLDVHALRHTAVTRLARAGVSLTKVQQLMGHSDPKLTAAVYTHLGVEDLRDAINALPSLRAGKPERHKEAAS